MTAQFAIGNTGGRPPTFESADQLADAINDYFANGVTERKVLIGKGEAARIETIPVPTITGLCYHIGFESRQSFYDYELKDGFSYTIKRARLFIEKEYEEQLTVGNTVGAIFALKNMGWRDKVETGITDNEGKDVTTPIIQVFTNGKQNGKTDLQDFNKEVPNDNG
jgi:hypothetical protein